MDDYTQFPFELYTINEIAQTMIQSLAIDDKEFVAACREAIKRRKPDQERFFREQYERGNDE